MNPEFIHYKCFLFGEREHPQTEKSYTWESFQRELSHNKILSGFLEDEMAEQIEIVRNWGRQIFYKHPWGSGICDRNNFEMVK